MVWWCVIDVQWRFKGLAEIYRTLFGFIDHYFDLSTVIWIYRPFFHFINRIFNISTVRQI
ncbi:MAG: hypothetical protein ACQEWF_12955 [Bacillota bacterium]